jgi:hypothetical protein
MKIFKKSILLGSILFALLVLFIGIIQIKDPMPLYALACCDVKGPDWIPSGPNLMIETFTDQGAEVTPIECRNVWRGEGIPSKGIQDGHYNCSNCVYWLDEPSLYGWFCMDDDDQIHCGEYLLPTRPSDLRNTASGGNYVHLTWSASSSPLGISGYRVFRFGNLIGTVGSSTTNYTDTDYIVQKTGLNSVSYYVQAYNSFGSTNSYTSYVYAVPLF